MDNDPNVADGTKGVCTVSQLKKKSLNVTSRSGFRNIPAGAVAATTSPVMPQAASVATLDERPLYEDVDVIFA